MGSSRHSSSWDALGEPQHKLFRLCLARALYADIVADFIAKGAESMQVTIEGMKPATLRAGLRRALRGKDEEGVRLAQRGEETYLVRQHAE